MNDIESQSTTAIGNNPGQQLHRIESTTADRIKRTPATGLLKRLWALIGFKTNGSLRDDLQNVLSGDSLLDEQFTPEERALLANILKLRETRIADVMVPRADIEAIEDSVRLGDLLSIFTRVGHSRMPVFRETLDDPLGMIHIKDIVGWIVKQGNDNLPGKSPDSNSFIELSGVDLDKSIADLNIVRPILFVPPSMATMDLLARMKATRTQMALVIDEYGGTDGLVSLEDVLETVVGDIEDEHDDDEDRPVIEKTEDNSFVADARVPLEELKKELGADFVLQDIDEDIETLGGLLFSLIGRVPVRGELITAFSSFEFEILDADPRRIKKLRIRKKDARRMVSRSRQDKTGEVAQKVAQK
ncbi:MAG: HlyC/CorC family transporter [Cohaesibacteraceae bacterium]|nr:HlyC/CorC family transporter [Cohaesibacteraceae bacterium]